MKSIPATLAITLLAGSLCSTSSAALTQNAVPVDYQGIREGAYSVVSQVRAKPDKEDALRAVGLPLIDLVGGDPKNLAYFLQADRTEARPFRVLRSLCQPG